ncbi:hypothetical protein CKW39_09005 [Kocuria sp. WRN011]|uniref:pyocin knob domain-containing protein n=1 Tax=Kocuria sp. WRN011 TaxID=2029858 RepID=UPI000BB05F5C|nr:pyocin knob domain-containing protein [Kocuria sp. WRN011]PBB08488.1 hypothetical protein CKW39_09005 [Kocuria sp. WRN011]
MAYDLQETPGGNAWLGASGTFTQLVEGLKAIALNRDNLDQSIHEAITTGDQQALGSAKTYADVQDKVISDALGVLDGKALKNEGILGTQNLNDIGRGLWSQPYQGNATEARNYPQANITGVLVATVSDPDNQIRQTFIGTTGIWHRARVAYLWGEWVRLTSTMTNRGNLGSKDLDDVAEGFWQQPYSSGATTDLHYPITTSGFLTAVSSGSIIWQTYSADAGRGNWRRKRGADFQWSAWERVDSSIRNRGIIGSTHLDQVIDEGTWFQRYSSGATPELGYPVKSAGQLEVRTLYAAGGDRSQTYWPTSPGLGIWRRVAAGSVWGAWEQVTSGTVSTPAPTPESSAAGSPGMSAIRRTARVDAARKRLLGGAGTGGVGAVALRFDDGHDAARDKVLPLLRKHALPGYWAVSKTNLDGSTVTGADLQAWALNDAAEVTSHSRTHSDSATDPAILDNVYTWADDLQSLVGQVVVDAWTFPGGGDFGGLNAGAYASLFADTYAGRLILERYAAAYGGTGGWLQPLTGEPTIGQSHVTIEAYTLAQVQDMVRKAQNAGMGITLMLHPSKLDTAGHMTSATLDQAMGWIAGEREAGRLVALTATGMAFANASSSHRVNMLPPIGPEWASAEWSISGGAASTSGLRPLTHKLTINPFAGSRGAPVELAVKVSGTAGDIVRINLTAAGGALNTTRNVTLTASTQWIYKPATIPAGTALGSSIDVNITRVSGGTVTVQDARLRTI